MFTPEAAFWIIVVWLVAIGGAVGSFLNVVVYRLPLGISLVYPPSRCPKCGKHIAWYDNVPVFGWLVLRGRCRQCHNPISARYPLVEAITALMFGAVAAVELPHLPISQFYAVYPYYMLLLCTLLCSSLIEYDGNRVPWRLFAPALVLGFGMPLLWPMLRLIPAWPESLMLENSNIWLAGAIDGLAGLAAGSVLGFVAWHTLNDEKPKGLAFGLICVGLYVGWQAVSMIALCTAMLIAPMWLPERMSPRLRIHSSMVLGVVTLTWILGTGGLLSWAWLASS